MTADSLRNHLISLHGCLEESYVSGGQDARDIVDDLGHICIDDVYDKDIGFCCSLMFHKDNGVAIFLKKVVLKDEFQGAKVGLLDLLLSFMVKHPGKLVAYAIDIKDVCMLLFSRDKYSNVKNGAITLLMELLRQTSGSKMVADLKVADVIEKFYMELTQPASKHSATVKAGIYHILGVCAELYPEYAVRYSERFFSVYVRTLKAEMTSKTKKPEISIIAGCLKGLTGLLVNFTQTADEDSSKQCSFEIFRYSRKAIDTDFKHTRYEMLLAGLQLFEKHIGQFSPFLLDDYQAMYEKLAYWSAHHNPEVSRCGMLALVAFLQQISSVLVTEARQGKRDTATFRYFIEKFRATMDNPRAMSRDIAIAIQGYGFFAAPCKIFLSADDVKFMFSDMIQRSEQAFFGETDNEDIYNMPSFLVALAGIIRELDEVFDTFLLSLERLVVLLLEKSPRLSDKMQAVCHTALLKVLFSLAPKAAAFNDFLAKIVYQGVIRACSHPPQQASDEEQPISLAESANQQISYRDYIKLWAALMDSSNVKQLVSVGVGLAERDAMTKCVYDELMRTTMKILDRLDLTATNITDEQQDAESFCVSDPVAGKSAAKPKDFVVFINLVEFFKELMSTRHLQLFRKWVFTFGYALIQYSTRLPVVSGFYKLLTVTMFICCQLNYFKGMADEDMKASLSQQQEEEEEDELMDVDDGQSDLAQRKISFYLFVKFAKEVQIRLQQYKDDLLGSCLCLILAMPADMVAVLPSSAVKPCLQMALRVGRSYLPLASATLDALEMWAEELPVTTMADYYKDVLPSMDAFLRGSLLLGSDVDAGNDTLLLTSSSAKKKAGRRKIPVRLLHKKKTHNSKETQFAHVQQRCVALLGSLGGATNAVLVDNRAEATGETGTAWDREKHLCFEMPFVDIKPVIYFDTFLPRIVQLAETSGERQTKVAACELLHALVLYALGRASLQPKRADSPAEGATEVRPLEVLGCKLFPVVLRLACDVEQVASSLFQPLMMQLIHWYSGSQQSESSDAMALLDSIMDGLVSPTDGAVRDFSAKCVQEFLKWSIKQTNKKVAIRNSSNVKSLLKRLYCLAGHPCPFKRLGAAVAFNNIYVIFREEECLVDHYVCEILVVFVESLALAHKDDKSLGSRDQCSSVLKHLQRIMTVKAQLLNKMSKTRRKPKPWGSDATLLTAVKWLLRQCGRPQTDCRHACMTLVYSLASVLTGVTSAREFFSALLKERGACYFVSRFESGVYKDSHGTMGIATHTTMCDISHQFSMKTALNWFDRVLAALDCYTWVLGEHLLTPAQLFADGHSMLFRVLAHFFDDLALHDISAAVKLFKQTSGVASSVFSPQETDNYNRAKCTVIIRCVNFLCVVIGREATVQTLPSSLWSSSLWQTILACVLHPSSIGFHMADIEVMQKLPAELGHVLKLISRSLPVDIRAGFTAELAKVLSTGSPADLLTRLPVNLHDPAVDFVSIRHLVAGLLQLHTSCLLTTVMDAQRVELYAQSLLNNVFTFVSTKMDDRMEPMTLSPTALDLANNLLKLAFLLGIKPHVLLEHLFDRREVFTSSFQSSRCGAIFYITLHSSINSHLLSESSVYVPLLLAQPVCDRAFVGSVLIGMLEQAAVAERNVRKKEGVAMATTLTDHWMELESWWAGPTANQESKVMLLTLLTKVMVIDSKIVCSESSKVYGHISAMYCDMLLDTSTSLAFKSRMLDLLAFFASMPDKDTVVLRACLDRFVADNFPSNSREYPVGSPKYNDYIAALNKLLLTLELSGSLIILNLVLSIVCKEKSHTCEQHIQNVLVRFVKRLPPDQHKAVVDVAFTVFTNTDSYTAEQRRSALQRVCLTLLAAVHSDAFLQFYVDHIRWIVDVLEARMTRGTELEVENQLVSKLCCFELVELMYTKLSRDAVNSVNSRVNAAFCQDCENVKGNETTRAVTKVAQGVKSEDSRGVATVPELRRLHRCAAYRALAAIITCTQTEVKFFNVFLFTEQPEKGQFLLENLVDKDRIYEFQVELDAPLERSKRFVLIRKELRDEDDSDESAEALEPVRYIASQYLADSSFSADISRFDFGDSASSVHTFKETHGVNSSSHKGVEGLPRTSVDSTQEVRGNLVEMEMDELNRHECMLPMMTLIRHLVQSDITTAPAQGSTPDSMPAWMTYLHHKLDSSFTIANVKLFIAKLVTNTEEVFRPFAHFWLSPLIRLVTSGDIGHELHYFTLEIIVTVLSWHKVAIPQVVEGQNLASSLLAFLMANCHHDTRSILRHNLEVTKTLVEVWRPGLVIPTGILYDNLNEADPKSKRNLTGIQLVGVVVANKLSPYTAGTSVSKDRFYNALSNNMLHVSKHVHAAAAEVVGMAMQQMADAQPTTADDREWLAAYVDETEKRLCGLQSSRPGVFIGCIYRIQSHYAPIARQLISRVLFMLPKLHGEFKTQSLEIIWRHVDSIENVYVELKSKGIATILTHRDESSQQVALKVVHGMLRYLKPAELLWLLPSVTSFVRIPSATCRIAMHEILMWVYDNYREDTTAEGSEIMTSVKEVLLQGLADENSKNRWAVQNFWSAIPRLPSDTVARVVAMLKVMYSPSTECHYLGYATNLLLEMTSRSPDYNRSIFEYPLSACRFQEYSVNSSWRRRHVAMTPLFLDTQTSQNDDSVSADVTAATVELRATQQGHEFSATVDMAGGKGPFNWLTQSSLDTFSDAAVGTFGAASLTQSTASSSSSLLFKVPKSEAAGFGRPVGANFGRARLGASTTDQVDGEKDDQQKDDIMRLKKRFVRDNASSRIHFAKRQTRINRLRESMRQEQQRRREDQVTIYRQYRMGELPDIQLKRSHIIAPLQALAQRDSQLARLLFTSVFCGILAEINSSETRDEVMPQLQQCLNDMLMESTQYCQPFIGSLLDIGRSYARTFQLDACTVNTACLTSLQQPLGILLLEETLLQTEGDTSPVGKRSRTTASDFNTPTWMELARLYKSLGDYDVVSGIFIGHCQMTELTYQAMAAEVVADYQTAVLLYTQGLEAANVDDNLDAELELWQDSRLQCLNHLTQWGRLEKYSMQMLVGDDGDAGGGAVPALDRIWEDAYCQDHYMPFILRSKLKQLLDGDESQDDLLSFVDRAMEHPDRKTLLETRYSEELALLYVWQSDDRASYYANNAINLFLQDWGSLDTLQSQSRVTKLQSLQALAELQQFISFMSDESNFNSQAPTRRLVNRWLCHLPDALVDSASVWDDVITNRCVYIDHIGSQLEAHHGMPAEFSDWLDRAQVTLRLEQASSARRQDNFPVALKQMKRTHKAVKHLKDDSLQLRWIHVYARTHQRRCLVMDLKTDDRFTTLLDTFDRLEKYGGTCSGALVGNVRREHALLLGETVRMMAFSFQMTSHSDYTEGGVTGVHLDTLDSRWKDKLASLVGGSAPSHDQLVGMLLEKAFQLTKQAVGIATETNINSNNRDAVNETHLALVKYCDSLLRQKETGAIVEFPSFSVFPVAMVTSLLAAMKNNSTEARQRFPRLLQIVASYPDAMSALIKKGPEVPSWMFIAWISQMTALLDKPESPAVQQILQSIATDYPNALIYPLKMSVEGYKFDNSPASQTAMFVKQKLLSLVASSQKLVDVFVSSLEQLSQPNSLFRDWFEDVDLVRLLNASRRDTTAIRQRYDQMCQQLMDSSQVSSSTRDLYGSSDLSGSAKTKTYRSRFAMAFSRLSEEAFGKSASKLVKKSYKDFKKVAEDLYRKMTDEMKSSLMPPNTLKEYSPWLASFQGDDYDKPLEIPGQYTGESKPLPEYHVAIASFDDRVLVMSSLRKPKRITIHATDARSYMFLVKGGEDVRQDERIMCLLHLADSIYASSRDTCCQRLSLRTYPVIPMTPRLGLIGWMEKTVPLKDFLQSSMTDEEQRLQNKRSPGQEHRLWIGGDMPKHYEKAYKNYSRSECTTAFRKRENLVPWDLLRRGYLQLSSTAEAYFTLCCHLVTSHAQLCITHYILGIGDRHLSNFMIDLLTGKIVGIDFGHAFGSATQFLPIPELMPFRLTRQLRNMTLPLRVGGRKEGKTTLHVGGRLEGTMIRCLRALRANADLLLATMDVFIKEPSVDWKQNAAKQLKQLCEDKDEMTDLEWYPREKISFARKKLQGYNPAIILRDELKLGHGTNPAFRYYEQVLLGDARTDVRAQKEHQGRLSAEQQAACLVEQATDPNILGRVYVGWQSWM